MQVVELNVEENYVRTAGADGYVRFWDFEVLNEAEPEEDSHTVYLEPTRTVRVGDGIHIKSIVNDDHNGRWIILDEKGAISTVEVDDSQATVKRLMEFHSGSIVGLATCPSAHFAVTAGADGSVRLYDYRANRMVYKRHFSSAATTMLMLPPHIDPSQRVVLVGFEDGVVRALARTASEWRLVAALKPHKKAASAIAVSHDGKMLATASRDGSVFFFGISSPVEYEPIAFTVMQAAINTISFSEDSARLLMGCESGEVMEVTLPNPQELDTSRTFEVTLPVAYYDFVLPKPPKEKKKKTKKPKTEENGEDGGKGGSSDETAPKDPPVHEEEAAEETKEGGEGDKEGLTACDLNPWPHCLHCAKLSKLLQCHLRAASPEGCRGHLRTPSCLLSCRRPGRVLTFH